MEVEAGREVDGERDDVGQPRGLGRVVHPPHLALDGEVHADEGGHVLRPDTRGADDRVGLDPSLGRVDAENLVAEDGDTRHVDALLDSHALLRSCRRVAPDDCLRRGEAVAGAVGRSAQALGAQLRDELEHLVQGQLGREHAERALQADGLAEAAHVVVRVEQEEVARLAEVDVSPDLLLEVAELEQRDERDADVDLVGELRPDAARGLARRPAPEGLPLAEHDVRDPELREVVRRAGAHGAAADDHDLSRVSWHGQILPR